MLSQAERARRAQYKQIERQVNKEDRAKHKALRKAYAELHSTDEDGNRVIDVCSYCGANHKICHKHRTGMCVDCGKLYDRWHKAKRLGIESEMRLLKPVWLERLENARRVDKWMAQRSENFYNSVKNTEVTTMTEVTSKACKQCGRELSIDRFRKYPARGRGVYQTKQGTYTICKDCESISNRLAALQRKETLSEQDNGVLEALREHYQKLMDKGLQPATAPARRLMGVDTPKRALGNDSFMSLLSSVQGTGTHEVDEHCRLVRERGYASYNEAAQRHKELEGQLRSDARYEEITELLDEWWEEEE